MFFLKGHVLPSFLITFHFSFSRCILFFREYPEELHIFVLRRKFVTMRAYRAHAHGFYIDKGLYNNWYNRIRVDKGDRDAQDTC
jgi:hypothetical protein